MRLSQSAYDALVKSIYDSLMNNPDFGLGERGECMDEAKRIVDEWAHANGFILEDPDDTSPRPIKITRWPKENIPDHADPVFMADHFGNERMVAVYELEFGGKTGSLFISEYEDGTFWTVACNADEWGSLTKCINFLTEFFKQ